MPSDHNIQAYSSDNGKILVEEIAKLRENYEDFSKTGKIDEFDVECLNHCSLEESQVETYRDLTGVYALQNAVLYTVEELGDGQTETGEGPGNGSMNSEVDEE